MREVPGMRREHREALRSNHLVLAKQLVPGELCQHLLVQRVLTEEMLELIEAKSGTFSRNVELLRLLPKRGPGAFDAFCRALRDTEQEHLASLLQEQLYRGPGHCPQARITPAIPSAPAQEQEGLCSPKRPRGTGAAERSLDDGDGPPPCTVTPCSAEFYQCHRDTSYRLVSRPKGLAIIVSNVHFGAAEDLVDRQGGEVDHWALQQLLESLGFSVRSLHDQTAEVMQIELLRFAQLPDHGLMHSCVVALLSHGVEGAVYGTDGRLLQLQDVFRLFDNDSCTRLQNKPKIFFIQACRGDETDCGVDLQDGKDRALSPECEQSDAGKEEPLRMKLPTRSDIICGYACLKGTAALRNTRRGSWYVQALTQVIASHAKDTHLADMLVKVNSLIKEREGFSPGTEFHRCKEMSEYSSTLCKDLYLFPGIYEQ